MVARRKSSGKFLDSVPLEDGAIFESKGDEKVKKDSLFLYFAVIAGSLPLLSCGGCAVWTSPVLPKFLSNNTDINPLGYPLTSYDASLIVGSFAIGILIAPLFAGKCIDGIGRKNTLISLGILKATFLVVLAFSNNLIWLLVVRTITGIFAGVIAVAVPIFISEIADDHNRGKLGCLMNMFLPLGQLYGFAMGSFLSVKYFTLTIALPLLLHALVLFLFIPETPFYFLHKGRRLAAVKSLEIYRSNKSPQELEKDILIMELSSEQATKNQRGGFCSIFSHQPSRRGFLIGVGISMIQVGTGITVILAFMGPIFEQAQTGLSGNMTSILVGTLQVIIFFSVSHVVEKLGRKPLLLFSVIFCGIPLFFLGLYFFMKEHNLGSYQSYSWLPLVSILFFIFSYSLGIGPIPMATFGELFPTHIRSTTISSILFLITIINAVAMTSFPILSNYIGISGCFWSYCAHCVLGAVFIHFVFPETKGKSFDEIQEILKGTKVNSDTIVE